jgi:hypothetical protein
MTMDTRVPVSEGNYLADDRYLVVYQKDVPIAMVFSIDANLTMTFIEACSTVEVAKEKYFNTSQAT